MNPSLETILKRMERSGQSECVVVADLVTDILASRNAGDTDDDIAELIDASMDEIIAAAKIVKAWAKKGVPA